MGRSNTETAVMDIRRKFSTEEKIRIVLDGLRGESWIAELCRREGINPNLSRSASDHQVPHAEPAEITPPAISRLDWRSAWQKSIS